MTKNIEKRLRGDVFANPVGSDVQNCLEAALSYKVA